MKLKDVGNGLKLYGLIRQEQFLQSPAFTDHQKTKGLVGNSIYNHYSLTFFLQISAGALKCLTCTDSLCANSTSLECSSGLVCVTAASQGRHKFMHLFYLLLKHILQSYLLIF